MNLRTVCIYPISTDFDDFVNNYCSLSSHCFLHRSSAVKGKFLVSKITGTAFDHQRSLNPFISISRFLDDPSQDDPSGSQQSPANVCFEHHSSLELYVIAKPATCVTFKRVCVFTTDTMTDPAPPPPLPPSSIPSKRPSTAMDDVPRPRPTVKSSGHREPREKKETWRKKEGIAAGNLGGNAVGREGGGGGGSGTQSEKQTGNTTPKGVETESPGLVRYQLPPPQFLDYHAHRAPPLALAETPGTEGEWFVVNDQ